MAVALGVPTRIRDLEPGTFFETVLTERLGRVSKVPNPPPFGTPAVLSDPFEEKLLHPDTWVVPTKPPEVLYLPSLHDRRFAARRSGPSGAGHS